MGPLNVIVMVISLPALAGPAASEETKASATPVLVFNVVHMLDVFLRIFFVILIQAHGGFGSAVMVRE